MMEDGDEVYDLRGCGRFPSCGIPAVLGKRDGIQKRQRAGAVQDLAEVRSGDGAFERAGGVGKSKPCRARESGVAASLCHRSPKAGKKCED